ncbi:MAG: hypothetical protein AB1757_03760 [Acidobacteriota bacterium]
MMKFPSLSITKTLITLLLVLSFLAVAASSTQAFDNGENKTEDKINTANSTDPSENPVDKVAVEKKAPNILYAPLKEINFEEPETPVPAKTQPTVNSGHFTNVGFSRMVMNSAIPMPKVPPANGQPLNKIPMTVGEKFGYFFKGAFLSPGTYGQAIFSGVRGETFDKDHDPEGVKGNFFADAGTRTARSLAFGTSAKFFERFFYASIFRQDPRYHRSGKKGVGAKIGYAITRVFVTEGDKGGSQFNISYLGGGVSAAFMSRLWEREERKSTSKVLNKWGTHIGLTMFSNILKEFLSGQ